MRLFFGIEPSIETTAELITTITKLQNYSWGPQIRWTIPENLHITLRFIGNCEQEHIPMLLQAVTRSISDMASFTIQLDKICLFPSPIYPHVLAITVLPSANLFKLAGTIEKIVTDLHFQPEKRAYLAHLTLGRLPGHKLVIDPHAFPTIKTSISINHITLFSSEQLNNKSIYHPLNRIPLK